MNILILSREKTSYSTRRLKQAAEERGHRVKIVDHLRLSMQLEEGNPELFYGKQRLSRPDAVIPRIGASVTFYGAAVVRQFEQMGVFTLNPSHAISVSRDKLRSLQVLSRHHIGMPETAFVKSREDVLPAIERLGGAPVIIKLLEGTQGVGVILADTLEVAQAVVETLQSAKQNVLLQRFVSESKGRDVRAFVVGGKVVAAMRRTAAGDEFRSNVHRGGSTARIDLDERYERTAIRAAQIMGLRVAGVDMLESDAGPQVMEVNSSPGLEGIEGATGIDVAGAVIDHIADEVLFPDVDLRQRLTLQRGYGVSEFTIPPGAEIADRTLAELALGEREIRILSVLRGGSVNPNPGGDFRLRAGDTVLAFGKQLTLRDIIPRNKTRPPQKRRGSSREG